MFKNRELSVRMRKAEKAKTETTVDDEKKSEAYARAAQKIIITGAIAVYGYLVIDGYRQIKVAEIVYNQPS